MTNYRLVAEVTRPTDDFGYDFIKHTEVLWHGHHHPFPSEELSDLHEPESPAERTGPIDLQQQRVMHLGWKTIHASVQRI
jgi:hypothetical protein